MSTFSPYFAKSKNKRPLSSESSESETPTKLSEKSIPAQKKINVKEIERSEKPAMSVQETLNLLGQQMNDMMCQLKLLATKKDVQDVRAEVETLNQSFAEKIENIEGRLLDSESKLDQLAKKMEASEREKEVLRNKLRQQDNQMKQLQTEQNNLQQYSRSWNLRILKVPEREGETSADCTRKCCEIFTNQVGVPTEGSEIEVAHRAGQQSGSNPRPILIRFFDRKKRDTVLANRKQLKETLHEWEVLDTNLTSLLYRDLPVLNATGHGDLANLNLETIRDVLLEHQDSPVLQAPTLASQLASSGFVVPPTGVDPRWLQALQNAASNIKIPGSATAGSLNVSVPGQQDNATGPGQVVIGFFQIPVSHSRRRRSSEGEAAQHDLLHDLTHSFHLGSMILLSVLLLESLLKVFAMGKKILHHKLEIFDAFVVAVSWALDVAFWEGIWAHPGNEAANILIFILPWRVVRIVNSFVLVIQEKDHVQLKIVKQRLRLSVKKSKESTRKASSYRTEVKQLQGLSRKYGATENEINACGPTGRTGRRRSSLMPAMERAASLTLISALGSHPSLYTMDSSSDEDDVTSRDLTRTVSQDPTLRSAYSITTLDSVFTIDGNKSHRDDDFASDNDLDNESTAEGLDSPVFITCQPGGEEGSKDLEKEPSSGDAERGQSQLAETLHQRLSDQPSVVSVVSVVSETSSNSEDSGKSGADPSAQDVPPRYHEAVSKQDSDTRL